MIPRPLGQRPVDTQRTLVERARLFFSCGSHSSFGAQTAPAPQESTTRIARPRSIRFPNALRRAVRSNYPADHTLLGTHGAFVGGVQLLGGDSYVQ